jgi:hypothetical protein
VATVTILDDDAGNTNSITQPVSPGVPESPLGSLRVNLLQQSAAPAPGQWRFSWELDWRDSGTVVSNLPGGNYELEFKPVSGYVQPLPTLLPMPAGSNQIETFYYTNTGGTQAGSLKVSLLPGSLGPAAAWRRVGEAVYHASDETVDSLPVGSYTLEFTNTTGQWVSPARRLVTVDANRLKEITAQYLVGAPSLALPPNPVSFETTTVFGPNQPYTFCGQLLSEAGWASGWVAKERVVLTAAHVVYDDLRFSFQPVGSVRWFFQRYAGRYEPPPKLPRGWCVFAGYSAQRSSDRTPGYSSLAAQDLDVAALYFYEPAARQSAPGVPGGYGGYLVSRPGEEWLFAPGLKTLAGYPVEGKDATGAAVVPGRTYATALGHPDFSVRSNGVYRTLDLQGLPGMSGGPLCVQWTNSNFFFPAAIYLGGSEETLVRLIDADVVDLINCAETMGDAGQDHIGGGPPRLSPGQTAPTSIYGFLTVYLLPPAVTNSGARYNFQDPITLQLFDSYDQQTNLFAFVGNNPGATVLSGWNIKFAAIPGYIAPPDRFIALFSGQRTNLFATYQAYGALEVMPGASAVRLLGSSGSVYRVEYATNLPAAAALPSGAWRPLSTQRLDSGSTILPGVLPTGRTNRFLRAVLQP